MPNLKASLGGDPEFMLYDLMQGKIVSAIPVLAHDKHDPIDLGDGYKVYSDNVLLEAQIPPSPDKETFVRSIQTMLLRVHKALGKRYQIVAKASHMYDETELGPKPEVMKGKLPVPWEIGCNPSLNVYTGSAQIPTPFKDGLRTGSFHIHLGNLDWQSPNRDNEKLLVFDSKELAIRLMDIVVGCASVLFDRDETAPARRALYGRAGEFRATDYGVEYRVLGNFPLRSPAAVELVMDLVEHVLNIMRNDGEAELVTSVHEKAVQQAINTCNARTAEYVLRSIDLPDKLLARCKQDYSSDLYKAWSIA